MLDRVSSSLRQAAVGQVSCVLVQKYFTKALCWYKGANTDECCAAAGQAKEGERWALAVLRLY
jgi:hypothetical protein